MQRIEGLSAVPSQRFRVPVLDRVATFTATYRPAAQMWFLDVEYDHVFIRGLRIVRHPNMLTQYENLIPFGLLVDVTDGGEPSIINDLQSERVVLRLLDASEVAEIKAGLARA